jgi:para-aminobenzoate synthetase component 1
MDAVLTPRLETEPAVPLVEDLTPTPDPWEVARRLAHLPFFLFLDSAAADSPHSRYSFLTADPFARLVVRGQRIIKRPPDCLASLDPFAILADCLARFRTAPLEGLPPFQGGAAGLIGYELGRHLEILPRARWDDFHLPDLVLGFYDWVIAFDHQAGRAWLISSGFPEGDGPARIARAARRLQQVRRACKSAVPTQLAFGGHALADGDLCPQFPVPGLDAISSNFERSGYLATVARAIEYIHAGDCFQVNLAQRLLTRAAQTPLALYEKLRQRNAAPFAGYFQTGGMAIASASPERFVRVDQGEVEARPIKGTRPCGVTPAEDEAQRRELLTSAKDRAENVMIVDLLRNDLGRVCEYGSVRVPAVCELETYRFVHHLVSQVRGRMRANRGPVDLLRAAFPGGSVTGAPKIRAMQIIAELEPTIRGPYCGSLGYVGFNGNMDTSILIRTFTVAGGWVQFPVGGGIVADSVPEREYEETLHKAKGMLRALK